ncbi:hypothetical protein [Streptomyces yangpuensis]
MKGIPAPHVGGLEAGKDVAFVIRFDDGTLVVPPGSKTDPKGMVRTPTPG